MTPCCDCCEMARQWPGYRMYSPACLYCGARLIQAIGNLSIPDNEVSRRRRAVLVDWVAHGHSEAQIRALALNAAPALPEIAPPPPAAPGPAQSSASGRPTPKKRR